LLGNEATGNRPWLGNIFLVALYNEALSAGKIERPHTAVLARTGSSAPVASNGLVALYTFTERSGTTVADSSPRPPVSLTIPTVVENVRPFLSRHSQLLSRPLRRPAIFDAVINLLLFVPFGLLACIVLEARGSKPIKAITIAIAATAAFSVGVESVQYLSVSRSSELQDVVLNILSSGIGAALYWVQPHRRQAAAGPRDGRPR
jgi:VanZ family protein